MFQTNIVEKATTHILYSVSFSGDCAVCKEMWKNIVEPDRPQMTI